MGLPLPSGRGVRTSVMERWRTCYDTPGDLEEISSAPTTGERFRVKDSICPTQLRLQNNKAVLSESLADCRGQEKWGVTDPLAAFAGHLQGTDLFVKTSRRQLCRRWVRLRWRSGSAVVPTSWGGVVRFRVWRRPGFGKKASFQFQGKSL